MQHGGYLGVSYLPGWSHTLFPWLKLDDVLGPEFLLGHLQLGLSGHLGQAICSLTQATAHALYCIGLSIITTLLQHKGQFPEQQRDQQSSHPSPFCLGLSPKFIKKLGDLHRL